MLVLGALPQIIKSAPFIHLAIKDKEIQLSVIHAGQHYGMIKIFFKEPNLPDPVANLNAGSSHAQQTAKNNDAPMKISSKTKSDLVIVPGDTNSTLVGALTAKKRQNTLIH